MAGRWNQAATQIQAVFRGHKVRRLYADVVYARSELERAQKLKNTDFQIDLRQFSYDEVIGEEFDDFVPLDLTSTGPSKVSESRYRNELRLQRRRCTSATRIQAVFRGHLARVLCWNLRRTQAAVCIQAAFRGHLARGLCLKIRRDQAAVRIQAVFRGFIKRRLFKQLKFAQNEFLRAKELQKKNFQIDLRQFSFDEFDDFDQVPAVYSSNGESAVSDVNDVVESNIGTKKSVRTFPSSKNVSSHCVA